MARTFVGTVSSDATDKTIVVTVSRSKTHPLYRKFVEQQMQKKSVKSEIA